MPPVLFSLLTRSTVDVQRSSDLGETRSKETPDPNVLLNNAELFLKKWENVESNKGKPILSEEALKEVQKMKEHMRKGCRVSFKAP